ncbi:hypothetical protein OS493_003760 [Desmophyllum pertusum]|uniref:Uncharacterized protein n=1 Tax=Desmophyllum pertusum TaxID=174260 RepID=A0A9X0A777_9CNID|nr:hypothetical protein OS493_003760 [Desmophyllum pertusum]
MSLDPDRSHRAGSVAGRYQVLSFLANSLCWLCFRRIMEIAMKDSLRHIPQCCLEQFAGMPLVSSLK